MTFGVIGDADPRRVITRDSRMTMRYAGFLTTRGSLSGRISSAAVASRMTPSRCSVPSASRNPIGSVNSCSVCNMSLHPFQSLVRELHRFDGDVVAFGVEVRRVVLGRPGTEEVPPRDLGT